MKNNAKVNLTRLVDKFERELTAGKIKDYNEEATKTAFIQPLLKDVLRLGCHQSGRGKSGRKFPK